MVKIISWNLNSIRTFKGGIKKILEDFDADIACFQETKLGYEQLTEELALVDDYVSFFSFCQNRSGYSGVATFCRKSVQAFQAELSLTDRSKDESIEKFSLDDVILKLLDSEGRTVITHHILSSPIEGMDILSIVNVYCPCVTGAREGRDEFRINFLQTLQEKINQLRKTSHVIVLGDINISHKPVDYFDPGDTEEFTSAPHRLWMDKIVHSDANSDGVLIDSFRHLNPDRKRAFTCWDQVTFARQTNSGARIDYILIDKNLTHSIKSADIHPKYQGSDHCPVSADLSVTMSASTTLPLCSTAERFKVKQKKLTNFFIKKSDKKSDPFEDLDNKKRKKQTKLSQFNKKQKI